jgi:hypothetical protein
MKSAEVSEQVASRDLRELVDKGLLIGRGETKGRIYDGSPLIREVSLRNYEVRTNVDLFRRERCRFPRKPRQVDDLSPFLDSIRLSRVGLRFSELIADTPSSDSSDHAAVVATRKCRINCNETMSPLID